MDSGNQREVYTSVYQLPLTGYDSLLSEEPVFQQTNSCPHSGCFPGQPSLLLFLLCLLFFMDRIREHTDFAETRDTIHHQMAGIFTS